MKKLFIATYTKALILFVSPLIIYSCGGGGGDKPNGPITPSVVPVTSVTLSKTSAEMEIGNTLQLTATVSPSNATDKSVTWGSSNSFVATVTPTGLVTAKAEGSANVTASCGGKSATCKVTVKKPVVAVTSVELDKTEITLDAEETYTLKATVKPDNATVRTVTWASSNTNVATVDTEGKVTGVDNGIANITATSGDISATCKVNVVVQVKSLALDKTSATLEVDGEPLTITAIITPANAKDKTITWTYQPNGSSDLTLDANKESVNITSNSSNPWGLPYLVTATCNGKTSSCEVRLIPHVKRIVTSPAYFYISINETIQMVANIGLAEGRAITWSSSNPSIVAVSESGVVRGIGLGDAIIYASCDGMSIGAKAHVISSFRAVAVDLGLSVKWADCNVGATAPEIIGNLYAWGETSPSIGLASTYKWATGHYQAGFIGDDHYYYFDKYIKYNTRSQYGDVDNKTRLEESDDVAHVKLGGNWRMPTREEFLELFQKCNYEYYSVNGVYGVRFKSKINGNSIFMPFVTNISSDYWTSDLNEKLPSMAFNAYWYYQQSMNKIISSIFGEDSGIGRTSAYPVRPVTD